MAFWTVAQTLLVTQVVTISLLVLVLFRITKIHNYKIQR